MKRITQFAKRRQRPLAEQLIIPADEFVMLFAAAVLLLGLVWGPVAAMLPLL